MVKNNTKPKLIVICGPTGSGKTSLAVSLCKKFNGEVVNADSRQVYKGMNIGTAKDLDSKIPTHLVDIVEPDERYNVGRFKKDAEEAIEDILERGKVPFIVGGTGLYIDALVENFQIPEWNQESRIKNHDSCFIIHNSKVNLKEKSLPELVGLLKKIDPEALSIVDLKNRRRVERAIEYCLTTGKKFSESRKKGERKYEVLKIAPMVDREKLLEKINIRVEEMIKEGLEKEVKKIANKYGWDSEAMTGIGYREWREYFESVGNRHACSNLERNNHGCSLQSVKDQIKIDTRHYAKRQMTWFKRDKEIYWIENSKKAEKLVKDFIS